MCSLSFECLESICKATTEIFSAFRVIEVLHVAEMPQVKWYVVGALSNQDHVTAQGVRDSDLIEDIRVSSRAVAYHNPRPINQGYDVLNDGIVFPNVVGAKALELKVLASFTDGLVDCLEFR